MALKYLVDLNINDNVLQNARLFSSGTAPTASIGAIYVDTGDSNKLKYHNGTAFVALGTGTATGDLTAIVAGAGLTGTSLSGPIPTLNVGQGTGITVSADAISVTPAQTVITSIYNTSLAIGYASDSGRITFADDTVRLICNSDGQCGIELTTSVFKPITNNNISLGTSTRQFKDAFFDGTVTSDAFSGPLTGNVTGDVSGSSGSTTGNAATATKISSITNSNIVQLTTSQTLTNKTLTTPTIGDTSNITFPTFNQNTTGSAATLTTARAINGVDFNGSAAITITAAGPTLSGTSIKSTVLGSSLTSVGALNSGSITSGFGAIDVGSSTISAGGFDASDGNIDNVGIISLDKIEADGSAITIGTSTSGDTVLIGHGTSEVTIGDNLTVSGDLTVNGTTTTVDSTTVAIGDNMMKYAKDNTANSVDIGWYGKAVVSSANKFPTMFYDASSGISTPLFQVGLATTEPGSTGAIAVKGTVVANLSGNATGSSGSCTGLAASATVLATARNIGGVSFNGSANIDLPGVNASGNQNTSGNAGSATILATARNIGGVSFDGSAAINLPGVNAAGNQNTSGVAAEATILATARNIGGTAFDGSANITPGLATTATTLATARTIGGVSFDGSANISLVSGSIPNNAANTTGLAGTATALATGRTIAMTGDVAWTSASFTGAGNVTGTSTIQAGAVEHSMLAVDLQGKQLTLNSGTSGITRSYNAGSNGLTIFVLTMATLYGTGDPDGRLIQVELYEASTYATVYADVARAAATVTITMKGEIDDSDYGILLKPVSA
jgi:hypothetical protein